jgi:hypothetical protein
MILDMQVSLMSVCVCVCVCVCVGVNDPAEETQSKTTRTGSTDLSGFKKYFQ